MPPTNFDSFCESGRGNLFESPLGARDCPGGFLVMVGSFSFTTNGRDVNNIAYFDPDKPEGEKWGGFEPGLNSSSAKVCEELLGKLWIGGPFTKDDDATYDVRRICTWDKANQLFDEVDSGFSVGEVTSLIAYDDTPNDDTVGQKVFIQNPTAGELFRVTGDTIDTLNINGTIISAVLAVGSTTTFTIFNGNLYMIGTFITEFADFEETFEDRGSHLCVYDGTSYTLGTAEQDITKVAIDMAQYNGKIYVVLDNFSTHELRRLDGTSLTFLETIEEVDYMIVHDGYLFIMGTFSTVDGVSCANIIRYDGTTFDNPFGSGFNASARCAVEFNDKLVIGGNFSVGDSIKIISWDNKAEEFVEEWDDGLELGSNFPFHLCVVTEKPE